MFKNITFVGLCFFLLSWGTLAAQDLGLHFMENVWQINHTNPAIAPDQRIIFSFPAARVGFAHSALSFNDVIGTNSEGQRVIDSDQLIANLQDHNYLRFQAGAETFNFAISIANMQFSLHHAVKANVLFNYPKTLAQLAFEGNAPFIGQEVDIAPSFSLMAYNEIGVGFNMRIANLAVGGRIKTLTGLGNLSSDQASIKVNTDEEIYQLNLSSNYQINTAGVVDFQIDGSDFDPDVNFDDYGVGDFLKMNRGWGIDLGAQLRLNDKLKVAASIVDLGFIRWTENTRNFKSEGHFSFEGFDPDDFILDDEVEFGQDFDTIFDTFNFQETQNAYTTLLPSKIYLSGNYRVNPLFRAGALFYLENQQGKSFSAVALSGTLDLGKIFSLGAVYSIYNRSYANVGLNCQLKLGPVQLFALSDNVLAMTRPASGRSTSARFGLNLAFGKRGVKIPVVGE